jgi:hypothetical protein
LNNAFSFSFKFGTGLGMCDWGLGRGPGSCALKPTPLFWAITARVTHAPNKTIAASDFVNTRFTLWTSQAEPEKQHAG